MNPENGIDSATVVSTVPAQVSVDLGEEVLILHLDTGEYYGLRNVAARVWKLLETPSPISEIAAAVAREYDIPTNQCEVDVLELVEKLEERGLISVVGKRDPPSETG